jgi:hypothetical protein
MLTMWYMVGRVLTPAEHEIRARQVAAQVAALRGNRAEHARLMAIVVKSAQQIRDNDISTRPLVWRKEA